MPSDPPARREPFLPGADFSRRRIPTARLPAGIWFRAHRIGTEPLSYGRFAHHRYSHPKGVAILYVAKTIEACLWEVFGDDVFQGKCVIAASKWDNYAVSEISVPALTVCALDQAETREAMGVDKASLLAGDLSVPQSWSRALQEHPAGFAGIRYFSRFVDEFCLAILGRDGIEAKLKAKAMGGLNGIDAAVDWLDRRGVALV